MHVPNNLWSQYRHLRVPFQSSYKVLSPYIRSLLWRISSLQPVRKIVSILIISEWWNSGFWEKIKLAGKIFITVTYLTLLSFLVEFQILVNMFTMFTKYTSLVFREKNSWECKKRVFKDMCLQSWCQRNFSLTLLKKYQASFSTLDKWRFKCSSFNYLEK